MNPTNKKLPELRRRKILDWLVEEGSLSIPELEARLGVSHMTIHRDLDTLEKAGEIQKIRGGAMLVNKSESQSPHCVLCGGRVMVRSEVKITLQEDAAISACCPHCAILFLADREDIESTLARDFLLGQRVNLFQAYFLINSDVRLCCIPSTLCFTNETDALKFQKGFSGTVMDFASALSFMSQSHKGK